MEPIDLLAELEEYDDAESLSLEEARNRVRGRSGAVNVEVLRRWCKRGCVVREGGPVLLFPAVLITGQWRTMPGWAEAFEKRRVELAKAPKEEAGAGPRTERSRKAGHKAALSYLESKGVKTT